MAKIELELPSTVSAEEARLLLAVKLYETQRLSLGKAAEFAGYSVRTFTELLARYGVALYRYPPEELESEVQRWANNRIMCKICGVPLPRRRFPLPRQEIFGLLEMEQAL